jgi:ATP-dependent Clp protease ATP-binding subunit ClpC
MGARPLRRAIQHYIEDPLADFVLGRTLKPGSTIMVDRKDEEDVDISVIEAPEQPEPEKVTVPPEEPSAEAGDDEEHDDE